VEQLDGLFEGWLAVKLVSRKRHVRQERPHARSSVQRRNELPGRVGVAPEDPRLRSRVPSRVRWAQSLEELRCRIEMDGLDDVRGHAAIIAADGSRQAGVPDAWLTSSLGSFTV
jgi:hypothetical protein